LRRVARARSWRGTADARESTNAEATRIACEELENGLVEYDFVEPASIDEDKDGNKRRK